MKTRVSSRAATSSNPFSFEAQFSEDASFEAQFSEDIRPVIGGTSNYNLLHNKPSINGVTLQGDQTSEDLQINSISNEDIEKLFSL